MGPFQSYDAALKKAYEEAWDDPHKDYEFHVVVQNEAMVICIGPGALGGVAGPAPMLVCIRPEVAPFWRP